MNEKDIPLIQLTIDGNEIAVPHGTTVYQAAKKLGIEIPIFCYQERMPPFGACRMCLVEVEKMKKLQASCTLEVAEGMKVKTSSQFAIDGRRGIVELLLINHPLDCPICDRGGECPLQENALQHGPGLSRFFEEKRRFKKPLALSPVLTLDRERCIICARCTRFSDLISGDNALEFIERGYRTEVGTPHGKEAESKFIGNTIMICPVGALTSSVYRFRARPWDNEPTNSSCPLCPIGCSLILDSRDGEIMRVRSRENQAVNDLWLCDKGWFGYEHTSHPQRLQKPYVRRGGVLQPTTWDEAFALISEKFNQARLSGKIAGLGGNVLTTEDNYLFQKLIRELGGVNHLDHRIGTPLFDLDEEGLQPGMDMALEECESLSFATLIGLDLTEEFPLIWLRLRQAINNGATANFIGHYAPEISKYLSKNILHAPGMELEQLKNYIPEITAQAKTGKKGALFIGRQYLHTPWRRQVLFELQALCKSHPNLSLNLMEGKGNSVGARFAGMRPDVGPAGLRLTHPGFNAQQVLEQAASGGWDFLYLAGANLVDKVPRSLWKKVRDKLSFLLVQDLFMTESAQQADLVLPTLAYVEKGGSFLNIEGRVQKLFPGKEIPENLYSDGEIFRQIAQKMGRRLDSDDAFLGRLQENLRLQLNHRTGVTVYSKSEAKIMNSLAKLKVTFAPALFDQGVRMKHNSHLHQMVKPAAAIMHPHEGLKKGIQNGDTVSLSTDENSIQVKIKLDTKVAEGTLVLPLGFDEIAAHEFGMSLLNGMEMMVEKAHT